MPADQSKINTSEPLVKKKRVQLKHVLIDVDFWDKPKIRALAFKHTHSAVHVLLRWLACMSRATNALVTRDALFSLAKETIPHGVGDAICSPELVLKYCLDEEILVQIGDRFTNERVLKDQESCAIKRESTSERQKKYREQKVGNSNALVTRLPDTATVTDTDLDPNKGECEGDVVFKRLRFSEMDWADLVTNHFFGDALLARSTCEHADDYLAQEGKPQPRDCLAYIRNWIRRSKEFQRWKPGNPPPKKLSTYELNKDLFDEVFKND